MKLTNIKNIIKEYFLINPTAKLRVRQIERILKLPLPSVIRYCKELKNEELLVTIKIGNVVFYTSNRVNNNFILETYIFLSIIALSFSSIPNSFSSFLTSFNSMLSILSLSSKRDIILVRTSIFSSFVSLDKPSFSSLSANFSSSFISFTSLHISFESKLHILKSFVRSLSRCLSIFLSSISFPYISAIL